MRAARVLARAEVVVYDQLVSPAILRRVNPQAELIYAGKRAGCHHLPQAEINALLVDRGLRGQLVCRLKGGEPFMFGRGGEEALALAEAGVPFEVVPGISSTVAGPAYAGIPVTHRGLAATLVVVTGHEQPAKAHSEVDWPNLARPGTTLVVVMCLARIQAMVDALLDAGRSPETPVAIISRATWSTQQTVVATLEDVVERVRAARVESPALAVVGEVVGLRSQLAWHEARPLCGQSLRIFSGPATPELEEFCCGLEELGAQVEVLRGFEVQPLWPRLPDWRQFHAVTFTTPRSVEHLQRVLRESRRDLRVLAGLSVYAVGEDTAAALRARGLEPDRIVTGPPRMPHQLVLGSQHEPGALALYRLHPTGADGRGCLVLERDAHWFVTVPTETPRVAIRETPPHPGPYRKILKSMRERSPPTPYPEAGVPVPVPLGGSGQR